MKAWITALLLVATPALAETRVNSVEECMAFADLALVASTLAKHGIDQDKARMMLPDIYQLENGIAQDIAQQIVEVVYQPNLARKVEPKTFATALGNMCVRTGGRLDGILGARL